ncbi:hypothetical protein NQ315_012192 [Exocentrus adspersus]|uniref:Ionotropic glutamate receptor C-terminal domain-containing protein n=1 Tax=Exocentrus adspersus TaxID=1586481 RepID=A0AAV8VYB6_9CUCU|nr:hypothetical protein NQ315_012192 [Exocentrus adspersus]
MKHQNNATLYFSMVFAEPVQVNLHTAEYNLHTGCNLRSLKRKINKFIESNIYLSQHSSMNSTEHFIQGLKSRASIVSFYRSQPRDEFVDQANKITFYGEKLSWLIILVSEEECVVDYLRLANFGLDADVTLAVSTMGRSPPSHHQSNNFKSIQLDDSIYENRANTPEEDEDDISTYTPFMDNNNNTSSYEAKNFCGKYGLNMEDAYCMLQIYKIRKYSYWSLENGTADMKPFLNTEKRNNLFQFPLVFGEKNSSDVTDNVIEDDDDETDIEEFAHYFSTLVNASEIRVSYSSLGKKKPDGEWSDLFGAIMKEEVDLGLDNIIKTAERISDMAFTHNIMESRRVIWFLDFYTMLKLFFRRNIYIQPQQSNELRDIFLVPFDLRLLQCVFGTAAILALIMVTYKKSMNEYQVVKLQTSNSGLLDSVIWSIGIFSQQGSIWQPGSCAERIIVIVSLAFTLIIYNAYSAFITSVLSVKLTNIRTVDDLLNSDYDIGYAKNSQDEIYLRSMNVTQLNQIYLRGYLHNNISHIGEGLLKAAQGNYGFFASSHIARRELLIINSHKCKYDIAEIPIKDTIHYIAFPMSKRSSYRKLINLRY